MFSYISLPAAAAVAKLLQSCLTLCDSIDGSPPGSPVPGILQARTLGWVAIFFSNVWKWKVKVKPLSRVWLLATPWTAAYQAPLSMGFSRQEYWSGVPLTSVSQDNINKSKINKWNLIELKSFCPVKEATLIPILLPNIFIGIKVPFAKKKGNVFVGNKSVYKVYI